MKRSDIGKNAVNSRKVANSSLLASDFAPGQIPNGARGEKGDKGEQGSQGIPGEPGTDGTDGTDGADGMARAYALGGGTSCPGTAPPFVACPIVRGSGVAYIVKVSTGVYCVGVNGIDAAASDSVAVVTVSSGQIPAEMTARWRRQNSSCVSNEFEVQTLSIGSTVARNGTNTGSISVAAPPIFSDFAEFTIAVL